MERTKKKSGDWMEGRGLGRGTRACETFFTEPLPPTFVTYLDNWISAVKMSICQFTEIVLGFLAQVVRANPVREQVTIVTSEKFHSISMCILQSAAVLYKKNVTCTGIKIRRVFYLVTKNKAWLTDVVVSLHLPPRAVSVCTIFTSCF